MLFVMERDDVLQCFAEFAVDRLINQFENDWLECKREPHRLDSDPAIYELAKDVSALANSGGGLLLLGFATKKDDVHGRDRIAAITPFARDLFSETRWRQLLDNWLIPQAPALRVDIVERDGGIVSLVEVDAAADNWPILIKRIPGPGGNASETMLAYCERSHDRARRMSPERFQTLLRDGLRYSDDIQGRLEALQAAVERLDDRNAPGFNALQRYPACRDVAVRAANLDQLPGLALIALPDRVVDLTELFSARGAALVRLLEHPPQIRDTGFNIQADINSVIVAGQSRRSVSPDHNVLEMYRDGVIVYAVRADGGGLCWPGNRQPPQINPIFLVEHVYLFSLLCHQVLVPRGARGCSIRLELDRMWPHAPEAAPDGIPGLLGRPIPHAGEVVQAAWGLQDVSPERFAAQLIAEMFWRFGIEADRIACTRVRDGQREIDPEAIQRLRG
jgi:hypothetical protein